MRPLNIPGYVAVITEGGAETAIIDILLDNGELIFTRDDMLENKVLRCRDAQTFQKRYLRKSFAQIVTILRILDSYLSISSESLDVTSADKGFANKLSYSA